jgi:hypothetical protein
MNIIEKEKFKIEKIKFKPKAYSFLKMATIYILRYRDKVIFLGNKYYISSQFRSILKDFYGDRYLKDYPNNFFKRWIDKEYHKSIQITKKIEKKRKPQYIKRSINTKKKLINRLKDDLKKEKEKLKKLKR